MGYSYFPESINWADKTILIFESEYCSALILKELLSSTNVRIIHIDKKTILENFYDTSINLIINGIEVNEILTGLKLTREIRLRYPQIPIIAHTTSRPEEARIYYAAGCNGFIEKPFRTEELVDMLMKYLGR
jgi:CheY-like chemotaxis protein